VARANERRGLFQLRILNVRIRQPAFANVPPFEPLVKKCNYDEKARPSTLTSSKCKDLPKQIARIFETFFGNDNPMEMGLLALMNQMKESPCFVLRFDLAESRWGR